jgi:hypothetical protein
MTATADSPEPQIVQSAPEATVAGAPYSVTAATIAELEVSFEGKPSRADFMHDWTSGNREIKYDLFWDPQFKDYRRGLLVSETERPMAVRCIVRRLREEEGSYTSECANLIWSIPPKHIDAVVNLLDERLRPVILRGIAELIFAGDTKSEWKREELSELASDHLAYILRFGDQSPLIRSILTSLPDEKTAELITSKYSSGTWLRAIDSKRSASALSLAAERNARVLAERLTETSLTSGSEIFRSLVKSPENFKQVATELLKISKWHLFVFVALKGIPTDQREFLLPKLKELAGVWPGWAAIKTVHFTSPATHEQGSWKWLTARLMIWWHVMNAAADWTGDLRDQRKRELKIYLSGIATAWIFLLVCVVLSKL